MLHQFILHCFVLIEGDPSLVCDSTNKGCHEYCSLKAFGKLPLSVIDSPVPCLSQETINNIEKFVFFIGYPRSGHSIIGSMMDAHPNMIIADHFNLFGMQAKKETSWDKAFIFVEFYRTSYCDAMCGKRYADAVDFKGYTLSLSDSLQGRYTTLKVIGDKQGGKASTVYALYPLKFAKFYEKLSKSLDVPFRFIHVVRNPYDMIATRVLYAKHLHDQYVSGKTNSTNKGDAGSEAMYAEINDLFKQVKAVDDMIPVLNLTVLEIHSADFIKDPKHTLRSICSFLDLKCPEDYLQACYDKTYRSVSRTRDVLVWDEQWIEDI